MGTKQSFDIPASSHQSTYGARAPSANDQFDGVPAFLDRAKNGIVPAKGPVKVPYVGKETPAETKALKAVAEPKPPKNTAVVLPITGSAAALRKALKPATQQAKAVKIAKATKPEKTAKVPKKAAKSTGGKSKLEVISALLQRKNGTTNAEILEATQWPSVSVPQQAKAAGLKLRKEKVKGKATRYFGSK